MNLVLDTNVLISALIFGGKPRVVFELIIIEKIANGISSRFLIDELLGILKNKFNYSENELDKIEELIAENFVITDPKTIPKIIKDDPCDNQILAITDELIVNFIISGDNHLLKIKYYKGIPIITPHYFLDKILNKSSSQ